MKVVDLNGGGDFSLAILSKIISMRTRASGGREGGEEAFLSRVKSRKSTSRLSLTLLFSNKDTEEQRAYKNQSAPLPQNH